MKFERSLLALCLIAAAGGAHAAPCAPAKPDLVTATLREMFAAATVDDDKRLGEIFAPGFYAYDGGKRFDGMALWALIRTLHGQGKKLVWTVEMPDVHIGCTTAWVAYINRGAVGDAKGMTPVTWLESADLVWGGDRWRVQFLQSDREAPPKP